MESSRVAGLALGAVFLAFWGAHIALAAGLARRGPLRRAAVAFFVPPLAPWWGWRAGLRWRTIAWAVALLLYAAGVASA